MMLAFPFESATIQSASSFPGSAKGWVADPTTPAGAPGRRGPGPCEFAVSTGMPAAFAWAIAGATRFGGKPSTKMTPALAWIASSMPRVASATELLASNPTVVTPTAAPPSFIPCTMNCSKGMLRLTDTYHIDLPLATLALNGWPAGFQELCGASAALASCWASDTLAVPLLPDGVLAEPQAAVKRHPETTRTLNPPIFLIVDLLIEVRLPAPWSPSVTR